MIDPHAVLDAYATEQQNAYAGHRRDFSAPRAFEALRKVLELHQPEKRWHDGSGEWSVDTPEETDVVDPEFFEVCAHCGGLEVSDQAPDALYRDSMWPCLTARAVFTPLAGGDTDASSV